MTHTILIVLVMSLISTITFIFTVSYLPYFVRATLLSNESGIIGEGYPPLSAIFDNVSNSVVQIVSITPPLFSLNPQAQNTTEVGAGFIYDDEGHIVTANHILAGADRASVVFRDGDRYDADVIGRDAFTDIAVLTIMQENNTTLHETLPSSEPVTLGNSSALDIGEQV